MSLGHRAPWQEPGISEPEAAARRQAYREGIDAGRGAVRRVLTEVLARLDMPPSIDDHTQLRDLVIHHRECEVAGENLAQAAKRALDMDLVGALELLKAAVETWDAHQWPGPDGYDEGIELAHVDTALEEAMETVLVEYDTPYEFADGSDRGDLASDLAAVARKAGAR